MLIIVTGASRGIGYELVRNLSKRAGVMVMAVSRNPAALVKAVKRENTHSILPLKADITTPKGRARVASTVEALGLGVNAVVNNAGVLVKQDFSKTTARQLHAVYHANVFSPYLLTQQLLPYLKKGSHVLNIGSMGGVQGSAKFAGLSAYSSSKAAVIGLSECLAEELRPEGISVNALALGAVQTEMLSAAFPGYKAPVSATQMAEFIAEFTLFGHRYFNGKVLPVSSSTP
jgi:3-oxoacyl-[acyl-carrier protein] reductase